MSYYPLFADLRGRPCLVVGGGAIAERKVAGLRAAAAAVTVVAPTVTPTIGALAAAGAIRYLPRPYRSGDLAGAHLAMVAIGDVAVADAVGREARRRRVWLNVADDPARCDFILPAVMRRGPLAVAVGTGGESPALAAALRDWIDRTLPDDLSALALAVAQVRQDLRAAGSSPEPAAWRATLAREIRRRLGRALAAKGARGGNGAPGADGAVGGNSAVSANGAPGVKGARGANGKTRARHQKQDGHGKRDKIQHPAPGSGARA
jgi:precorrin-2 dehydrogenase / sirohydrochlorin ferrochelatase